MVFYICEWRINMNRDLKIIKKKYGEEMMHLCRELFPILLETEGLLPTVLMHSFKESHSIAQDIKNSGLEDDFKNYIYSFVDVEQNHKLSSDYTPEELLEEVGYLLYECHTEEEIQSFKKYYAPGEELCTFHGGRLERCHVFFAVKENVEEIKRENFKTPERQDEYGTSVISIQFTRDSSHVLSIKNRYNHSVCCPDSTFGNNLDNIIPGLTDSFAQYYGMKQSHYQSEFELPGYVKAKDGKFYGYNYEIDNVYYCENNIIIDNFEVKEYPKERYIIFDYFILDLQTKKIEVYEWVYDSFPGTIGEIERVEIKKQSNGKLIEIYEKGSEEPILLGLDQYNRSISLVHNHVQHIPGEFLAYNDTIERIELSNVTTIGDNFLYYNSELREIKLPEVTRIGSSCLFRNKILEKIELPNVVQIEDDFLFGNKKLRSIELPKVKIIGHRFLFDNEMLQSIELPMLCYIGNSFLYKNRMLEDIKLPNVIEIGRKFLEQNRVIEKVELPNLIKVGDDFLAYNKKLRSIELPKVKMIGYNFLFANWVLQNVELPNVLEIDGNFLRGNRVMQEIKLPNVLKIGFNFLILNEELEKVELPNVLEIGDYFLEENKELQDIKLPNVVKIRNHFLFRNKKLRSIELPNVVKIGNDFLFNNEKLQSIVLPKLESCGECFCRACNQVEYVYIPLLPELEKEIYLRSTKQENNYVKINNKWYQKILVHIKRF